MNMCFQKLSIATMELNRDKLNIFQKQLDEDEETKSSFVDASNDESDSETEGCKIVFPKHKRKRNDTIQELLHQLLQQNKELVKIQKKQYELQSELDQEEIRGRYVKLDLNNAQVAADDAKDKLKTTKKRLFKSQVENWVWRSIMILFFLYQLYCLFKPQVENWEWISIILLFFMYQLYCFGQYVYRSYSAILTDLCTKTKMYPFRCSET